MVLVLPEDLHAETRQIEVHDVDTTLVPVEQTNPTVVGDTQIRWPRITVNHRSRNVRQRNEHGEHIAGGVIR